MMIILGMLSEKLFFFSLFTQAEASIITKIDKKFILKGVFWIREVHQYE